MLTLEVTGYVGEVCKIMTGVEKVDEGLCHPVSEEGDIPWN